MSTTPVRITMRANEWGIIADILEDAAREADKTGVTMLGVTARSYARYLNEKIEGR